MSIHIRHVVVDHQIADAVVTLDNGSGHRVGHHPSFGWHCVTCDSKRCPAIERIRPLIPDIPRTTPTTQEAARP